MSKPRIWEYIMLPSFCCAPLCSGSPGPNSWVHLASIYPSPCLKYLPRVLIPPRAGVCLALAILPEAEFPPSTQTSSLMAGAPSC